MTPNDRAPLLLFPSPKLPAGSKTVSRRVAERPDAPTGSLLTFRLDRARDAAVRPDLGLPTDRKVVHLAVLASRLRERRGWPYPDLPTPA